MAQVTVVLRDGRLQEMPERFAKILVRLGRASLVAETEPAKPERSKPAAKTPRTPSADAEKSESKRVYRRRDLQAEE